MTLSVPELDFVAQELKAAPDLYHSRLLRVKLYAQLFQDSAGRLKTRAAASDEIDIAIADWCGHDSRGNRTIQRPERGEEVLLDDALMRKC